MKEQRKKSKDIIWILCFSAFCLTLTAQNVGIGTTKPEDKLTVAGTIRSNLNSNSTTPQIKLFELGDDFARIMFNNDQATSNFTLAGKPNNTSGDAKFNIFYSDFGNVLTATGTGRIGVNASNPAAGFHVNSVSGTDPFRVQNDGNTKFRIFSNNAISFGSNWQNPIQDAIRFSTSHMMIGHADTYQPVDLLDVNGTIRIAGFNMPVGHAKDYVLTSDGDGEGYWAALPMDNDSDPANEIQTLNKSGNTVTLSNGGGSFTDDDQDADFSTTNELQNLSRVGNTISISNGNSINIPGGGGDFIEHSSSDFGVYADNLSDVVIKTDGEEYFKFDALTANTPVFSTTLNNHNLLLTGGLSPYVTTGTQNVNLTTGVSSVTFSGDQNLVLGIGSGTISGDQNVYIGDGAGGASGTYNRNVILGAGAGSNVKGNAIVAIGEFAGGLAGGLSVYIGKLAKGVSPNSHTESCGIGYNAATTASNQFVFGNANTSEIGGFEPWSNLSDGRFKNAVREDVPGLDFINELRPVSYQVNKEGAERFMRGDQGFEKLDEKYKLDLRKRSTERESGFIAQEVEQSAQKLNYSFDGVVSPQSENDPYAIAYSQFVVPLVKAVQELDLQNQELKKENQKLKERLEKLEKKIR